MFYTTGKLPITPEARDFFINDWLQQKGHGFIGVHSATDTLYDKGNKEKNEELRWYWDMVGGSFNGHPWGSGSTNTFTIHDTNHAAMKPFGTEFVLKDEIYQYINWQPEKVRVLMSLNMEKCNPKMPYHVPVAWCKTYGEGKVYVNNMGHNESTWQNKDFLQSMVNAIDWIKGDATGDATPNPEISAAEEAKAKAVAANSKPAAKQK
jgi:type 1 glutamine amidotransferase